MTYILLFLLGLFLGQIKRRTLMREGKPYLVRTTLLKCPWFSLKIHKALMSDPAVPHDHPWNYYSLILWGGYYEEVVKEVVNPAYDLQSFTTKEPFLIEKWEKKWYRPGSLLIRIGDKLHRLIIPEGKYSISLILTTKKWRDWGFWDFYEGWVSHKQRKIY